NIKPQLKDFEKEMGFYKEQDEDVLSYALFPAVAKEFFEYRMTKRTGVDSTLVDREQAVYPIQ
ncbi:MAG: oxaloacetate decarboxylase subunit alpha, partial [Lachnospiraceae bacterium]|nr:oxaloacetate decarboxylase subunit alpha [Lachnospiraceae bacterium]